MLNKNVDNLIKNNTTKIWQFVNYSYLYYVRGPQLTKTTNPSYKNKMKNKTEKRELQLFVSPQLKKELDLSPSTNGVRFEALKKIQVKIYNEKNPQQNRTLEYDEMVQRGITLSDNELNSMLNDIVENMKDEETPPSFDDLKNNVTIDFIDMMFEIQKKMMMTPLIVTLGDKPKWYNPKGFKLSPLEIWGEFDN